VIAFDGPAMPDASQRGSRDRHSPQVPLFFAFFAPCSSVFALNRFFSSATVAIPATRDAR
jgi:hypothetical protein